MNKLYLLLFIPFLLFFDNKSSNKILIVHKYYTIVYDTILKIPFTTHYKLDTDNLKSITGRSQSFTKDTLLASYLQFGAKDYLNSGYDKGHLFNDLDNRWNVVAEKQCMVYTNVAPQNKAFNEHLWYAVENCERDSAKKYGSIEGYTGCLYTDKRVNGIPLPRVYWKVILKNGKFLAAWEGNNVTPISFDPTKILISKDSIEKETGISF